MIPETFLESLLSDISAFRLKSATLSAPRKKEKSEIVRKVIRPILVKNQPMYQISSHDRNQVFHHNLPPQECADLILEKLKEEFRQGLFCTDAADYHILVNKKKKMTVLKKEASQSLSLLSHNRPKNYVLNEGDSIPFLIELGIMTAQGKVIPNKYHKFRQINRFLEMVRDILPHLPQGRRIEIVDFGCGKAYLTFALYHYLHHREQYEVNIVGLDLKKDVIHNCRTLATNLGESGLTFVVGDINQYVPAGKVDLVISLHACDTATDGVLERAVHWGADVILCVPCCQHELYNQVESPPLNSLLRHGILKERFAALATDAVRAELLTAAGYHVQILEFIDMEHTPKNLLIRAVKDLSAKRCQSAEARYAHFKQALQITPCLEDLLQVYLKQTE